MTAPIWTKIPNKSENIAQVPLSVGVYRYWQDQTIIYVGKSVTLRARLNSHAQNAKYDVKEKAIVDSATHIDYTLTDNDFKSLLLEAQEIKLHQPLYNRILKDDKSYLYLVINLSETYPKPRLVRATDLPRPEQVKSKLRIFGPFPSTAIVESILSSLRKLIPFCEQKQVGRRACFYSHLGLCQPCPSYIEQIVDADEKRQLQQQYRAHIRALVRVLDGSLDAVLHSLKSEIKAASDQHDFELALKLRNKITDFERYIATHSFSDRRIISYHSSDSALESLHLHLGLPKLDRIECYDASHTSFQYSVVAMVVARGGELDRSQYRRFRLQRPTNRSDFDQLEEALLRRLKHSTWSTPDLIVIDGGAPQLRKLQPLLDQLPTPPLMIGLAKHPDHLIIPKYQDENRGTLAYQRLDLPLRDHGLNLLQTLRDEAHRFGNSYRRLLQKTKSEL